MADEWSRKWDAEDLVEHAELECIACLFDVLGPECLDDPASCSNFVQNGATAFLANSKSKKGKGKGKGKYPVRPSNLSIEDRRKKLAELKSKTECKDCGRRGHWKGDKECTMNKHKTAHLTTTTPSPLGELFSLSQHSPDLPTSSAYNVDSASDEEPDDRSHAGYMMTGGPVRYTLTRPTPVTAPAATNSSEWTVVDEAGLPLSVPEGGDRKFPLGLLRGRTFLDVTLKDKLQYFSIRGSKHLNPEQREYAQWVENHFTAHRDKSANGGTIDVWLTLKPAMSKQDTSACASL